MAREFIAHLSCCSDFLVCEKKTVRLHNPEETLTFYL